MPSRQTILRARKLRGALTPPEAALWTALRARPAGQRFRRQHPLGPYILDFYCPAARLAIEVDGKAHDMGRNPGRDAARDAWLAAQGVTVLRLPAALVLTDLPAALRTILARCAPLHQPPAGPPPRAPHREETKILPISDGEGDRAKRGGGEERPRPRASALDD